MSDYTAVKIAADWVRNVLTALERGFDSEEAEGTSWANFALEDLISTSPDGALEVIEHVVDGTDVELVLSTVAAGPMEDLVVRYGQQIVPAIARIAKTNLKFRKMLRGVWLSRADPATSRAIARLVTELD